MGELFERRIPGYDDLCSRIERLNEPVCKMHTRDRIVFLPRRGSAFFIGDLHGDFEALVSIVRQTNFVKAMERRENRFLVFLGDYGDRGAKILKTINGVITLKLRYPGNVFLLQGNHEQIEMAEAYGSYEAFVRAYGLEKGLALLRLYCSVMVNLPVAAISPNGVIGVHGGIPSCRIDSLDVLNGDEGGERAQEMIWNDPDERISGWEQSRRGGDSKVFGEDAFEAFMKAVSAIVMVRSHQYFAAGVRLYFKNRLATIFSNGSRKSVSSAYSDVVERAVFLKVALGRKKNTFTESDFIEITY